MTAFSSQLFELLKSYVLENSHLTRIQASDCKTLSAQISNKTSHTVSETTLKRIYGFALSKFKPSLFTIDVLSNYCGYNGWDDFCKKQDKQHTNSNHKNADWDSLSQKAAKITNFTLQALKNKSGIPFNQSIKRSFLEKHFDEFLKGDYAATVLLAPPSYGKTIALCHWVDERQALNITSGSNDIILFFSSNALMNVLISGKDFNDWLLALLGYTLEEDIISLLDENKRKEGNFYLIIDGLDEHMFKNNWFQLLLDQLMDIFSFYQAHKWFKMVLTMRSANWINNRHVLDPDHPKWFIGTIIDPQLNSNVPLFNLQEIKELCLNINPEMQTLIPAEVASSFNHPLYFQFYYKQHKDNFSLNNIDHTSIYDLISNFIFNKIYLGHHAADKTLLLKGLIENMDFKRREYDVDKLRVNDLFSQYNQAYKDLLSIGFLKETNTSNDAQFNTYVQFGNNNFLELAIANKLLYDNNNTFDGNLIKAINLLFSNNELKVPIIKWCVMHAMKNGQQENFSALSKADLNPRERSDLVVFLGDMLNKAHLVQNNTGAMANYFKQDCSDGLFYYFLGLELITPDYKKTLQSLLKFELSNYKKILTNSALAIIAVLQLDLSSLEAYLIKLNAFSHEDYQEFTISPLECLNTIYYFFRYGIIKKDFFVTITRFYFNPPKQTGNLRYSQGNDLVYLLAGYTLLICQKPRKMLRYINALQKVHFKDSMEATGYNFFLKILLADSYFLLGRVKELKTIHDHISELFKTKENSFTPYMKLAFYSLKIKKAILNNEYNSIPGYFKYLNQATEKSGNKFAKVFTINLLINSPAIVNQDEAFYKQLAYSNSRALRECGLSPEIFSNHDFSN
ncbi:hypothetical protein SAMN05428975_1097 [Mucilaginibacter sp. OK268]|uniref:hypothetical protein n=1 Tax=Mucilaginibacter sp. OK268 TaxID=1881048 RepID=UPI00088B50A1|nr:hypothetical protein [Mucilaginibacter sp. OK268]SDP30979.1 hypothetical protein SAMN05428975_1097 [Mucilaginibacter sp. OK268]